MLVLRPRPLCVLLLLGIPIAAAAAALPPARAVEDEAPVAPPPFEEVAAIVARFSGEEARDLWLGASALEALGEGAIEPLQSALRDSPPPAQLMLAKALISLGEAEGVDATLIGIARNTALAAGVRLAAIRLLRGVPGESVDGFLKEMLESDAQYDPTFRVALAASLSNQERVLARKSLEPLLDTSDVAARRGAALALAGLGSGDPRVREILSGMKHDPTPEGAQAKALLLLEGLIRERESQMVTGPVSGTPEANNIIEDLRREVAAKEKEIAELHAAVDKGGGASTRWIARVLAQIHKFYEDPKRVDQKRLIVEAIKGMAASLDPHSSFMDVEETREFGEDLSGDYAGIGAEIGQDESTGHLVILRPLYQGPAYKHGLRSGDLLTEVDGIRTKGLGFEDLVQFLKGTAGSEMQLKVLRRGWSEEREYRIPREKIHLDSVLDALLPGEIGYLGITRFGDRTLGEFETALGRLEEAGMKGLIIDLRNNPGGYLEAAKTIVDAFVGADERPIVTQTSTSKAFEDLPLMPDAAKHPDYPIAVLINGASASASEIVSGALQDYGRATVIGERSFGKGSIQRLLPMPEEVNRELGGETKLRLTVQYYVLPSGRSIHTIRDEHRRVVQEGGVIPDIVVVPDEIALCRLEAIDALLREQPFQRYLERHLEPNRSAFEAIADLGDGGSTAPYPEFREFFHDELRTSADDDDVRRELRRELRRVIQDARGKEYACDWAEDLQLQRAILCVLEKLGTDPGSLPPYAALPGKFSPK